MELGSKKSYQKGDCWVMITQYKKIKVGKDPCYGELFNELSGHRPFLRLKNKIKWITYDNNDVSKAEHDIILQITEFRVLIQ